MEVDTAIFRAYDIRGIYGKNLNGEIAENIGKAFGTFIGEGKTVVIGRDPRAGGEELKKNFIAGVVSTGCNVIDIGLVTIPAVGLNIILGDLAGGVMVTASHNPKEWNGFVLMKEKAVYCSEGMGMEKIRELFQSSNFKKASSPGTITQKDVLADYKKNILDKIKINKKLKIVIDAGHGAASNIASDIFRKAGCEVIAINDSPDGNFPSHKPDVTEECLSELKARVVSEHADLGVGFDCDADRLALIDETGRYAWSGNVTIPILAEHYLKLYPGSKIVFDVTCSNFLEEFVKSKGGVPIWNRVGHAFIVNRMMEEGAIFGGEYSNHLYFKELYGLDDAIFAALKMVEILSNTNQKFSEKIDAIPKYPSTKIEEIRCADEHKFSVIEKIIARLSNSKFTILNLDGVRASTAEGWFLIRASNTMPVIKINAEGKTVEKANELHSFAAKVVREEIERYGC